MFKLMRVDSATKAVAVVEKKVRIGLSDSTRISMGLIYHFDLRLSNRGSDFRVYTNTGYTENTRDTDLLVYIANALMTPRSGVQKIDVRGFSLAIDISAVVQTEEITRKILDAAHRAGYMVEYTDLEAERRARRER